MYEEILKFSFQEDLAGQPDVTSSAIFSDEKDVYKLVAKQDGILCGKKIFAAAFAFIDEQTKVQFNYADGDEINKTDLIATVEGKISSILTAERIALNFLSHLSGIATKTAAFVQATRGKTKILDTRKTLPGLRQLQKYAVRCGGGQNHRMGLYDMVMIKDNHIDGAGSIEKAVDLIRKKWHDKFKIEVETRNIIEVKQALAQNVDVIMLDNMSFDTMKKAVKIVDDNSITEASGNMSLERIAQVAETGVDFISVGELTHTVKAFDFSLKKG
jgi:nicotinate-nucleotide pyrophosphorylase (carboxylating)